MDPQALLNSLSEPSSLRLLLLAFFGLWAGIQNALAGGGSFITLPALIEWGLSPIEANITSTVALFPGQVVSGGMGWKHLGKQRPRHLTALILVSLIGGAVGGQLLVGTPSRLFSLLLPWLVLFATLIFVWGTFRKKGGQSESQLSPLTLLFSQFMIGVYGGYFGGGIGFLMLAALTIAGFAPRISGSLKNLFAAAMNLSAVLIFSTSADLYWLPALTLGTGALIGFSLGSHLLGYLNEKWLRGFVILVGFTLTIWLFIRHY